MPKKKVINGKPEVHSDLKGFNIGINEFGEITTSLEVDKLNTFLDVNVIDKKLKRGQCVRSYCRFDDNNFSYAHKYGKNKDFFNKNNYLYSYYKNW